MSETEKIGMLRGDSFRTPRRNIEERQSIPSSLVKSFIILTIIFLLSFGDVLLFLCTGKIIVDPLIAFGAFICALVLIPINRAAIYRFYKQHREES